jgi:hypothetical protein
MSLARRTRPDLTPLDQVVAGLKTRMPSLAAELAPQGRREGGEWSALNPTRADSKPGSFKINLQSGLWSDFATGDKGDALGLVAYLVTGGDLAAAIRWARDWLGLSASPAGGGAFRRPLPAHDQAAIKARTDDQDRRKRDDVLASCARLWDQARPLAGTPAAAYLAGRGVDPARLDARLSGLRYHPGLYAPDDAGAPVRTAHPALLGLIIVPGKLGIRLHRTFLAVHPDGRVTKAAVACPKMTLGSYRGGAIRLTRGACARPLKDMPPGQWVTVTEGIEDGLSYALGLPDRRVWCGVSVSNFAALNLPDNVAGVEFAAQNDPPGSPAWVQVERAAQALIAKGLKVRIVRPPPDFKDWNDLIRGVRKSSPNPVASGDAA